LLHLGELAEDMIRGNENTIASRFSPHDACVPRNNSSSLFLRMPDQLPVIYIPVKEDIVTQQSQPCCKPS
jgi:hypothetical protein